MVPSNSADTQTASHATHTSMSLELKGQLLDIVGLQSNIQIFTAKYPKANVICGMQVDGSNDLQWQCYGPDAAKPEVHRALVDFINEEYRYQKQLSSGVLDPAVYTLPRNFAKFNILRNFIDAAAMAGIVAGVQVTMLLDLANKLCDSAGAEAAAPPAAPGQLAAAALAGQQLRGKSSRPSYPAASSLISMNSMDTTKDVLSLGGANASTQRGGRKPRFTKEQQAAIMESVERNYAQHPSRYTELVIKEIKEQYPDLPLTAACVRKIKFRANEAAKAADGPDAPGEQREQSPAPATSFAPLPPTGGGRLTRQQLRKEAAEEEDEEEEEEEEAGSLLQQQHQQQDQEPQQQHNVLRIRTPAGGAQQAEEDEQTTPSSNPEQQQQPQQQQVAQGGSPARRTGSSPLPPRPQQLSTTPPRGQQQAAAAGRPPASEPPMPPPAPHHQQLLPPASSAPIPPISTSLLLSVGQLASSLAAPPPLSTAPVQLPAPTPLQVLPVPSVQQLMGQGMPPPPIQQSLQAQLMGRGGGAAAAGPSGLSGLLGTSGGDRLLQCLEAAQHLHNTSESSLKRPRPHDLDSGTPGPAGSQGWPASSSGGGAGGASGGSSKRQRMTPEQMSALMESVKHHITTCPERYTQLVMKDMKEKYPELELNMGQIRKIKFRAMGNSSGTAGTTRAGGGDGGSLGGWADNGGNGLAGAAARSALHDAMQSHTTQALLAAAGRSDLPLTSANISQIADALQARMPNNAGATGGGLGMPSVSAALAMQLGAPGAGGAAGGGSPRGLAMPMGTGGAAAAVATTVAMLQQGLQSPPPGSRA